nr:MAG TPA: hypothetical protein [Caudoviricetes sp.]
MIGIRFRRWPRCHLSAGYVYPAASARFSPKVRDWVVVATLSDRSDDVSLLSSS